MSANGTYCATAYDMPLIAIKATVNLKLENKNVEDVSMADSARLRDHEYSNVE